MSDEQAYVAGFLIDRENCRIAMVRKNRPDWMAGKLNAIGGKIEPFELPLDAMVREFGEETGYWTTRDQWHLFALLDGGWGMVYFYRAEAALEPDVLQTMEDEQIEIFGWDDIPWDSCMPNLSWLIPLALYTHDLYHPVLATEAD